MPISTVVPKPKGKHVNITESDNNRGIALSSILLVSFLIWSFCIDIMISYVLVAFNLVLSVIDRLMCARRC